MAPILLVGINCYKVLQLRIYTLDGHTLPL